MCHMNKAEWYRLYTAAISETDPAKICMRIRQAEQSLLSSFQNLAEDPDLTAEREVMANALSSLRALERTYVRYR
jgi:hypothetical protein